MKELLRLFIIVSLLLVSHSGFAEKLDRENAAKRIQQAFRSHRAKSILPNEVVGNKKHLVFNLCGSFWGSGDVILPFFMLLDLQTIYPQNSFTAVVDEYALKVLPKDLQELAASKGIKFVNKAKVQTIPRADYSFELMVKERMLTTFSDHPYVTPKTKTIISTTYYDYDFLDVVHGAAEPKIAFIPPGIARGRSGIPNNPGTPIFEGKSVEERRQLTCRLFEIGTPESPVTPVSPVNPVSPFPPISKILSEERFKGANLGFFYGAHNTLLEDGHSGRRPLKDQTQKYLTSLKRNYSEDRPLIVFTPNKREDVASCLASGRSHAYTPEELVALPSLEPEKTYVVSVGNVTNEQFIGLLSSSDTPVLLEGVTATSAALRLNIPFVVYRSPWNGPQIRDLVDLASNCHPEGLFQGIYDLSETVGSITERSLPDFDRLISRFAVQKQDMQKIFNLMNQQVSHFSRKLADILELLEESKRLEYQKYGPEKDRQIMNLAIKIQTLTHDPYLEATLIRDLWNRGHLSDEGIESIKRKFHDSGLDHLFLGDYFERLSSRTLQLGDFSYTLDPIKFTDLFQGSSAYLRALWANPALDPEFSPGI